MKRYGGLALLVIALISLVLLVAPAKSVFAACDNVSTFGAVRLTVPELPRSGDYALWIRMQSVQQDARVRVEINEDTCIDLADSLFSLSQWKWVTNKQQDQIIPVNLKNTNENTLTVFGVQSGVRVDRIIFTSIDCVPQEFGNNCSELIETALTNQDDVRRLSPPSPTTVEGRVVLSKTPERAGPKLKSVSYSVNGRVLQKSTSAVPFDTTLLENGKYEVYIDTTLDNGTVTRESTVIDVDNPVTVLSPLTRWLKIHKQTLQLAGLAVLALTVVVLLSQSFRRWYLQRRERKFHGF